MYNLHLIRRNLFVVVLFLVAHMAIAQYPGFQTVEGNTDFKNKLITGAKTVQSIASDFTQEKHLSVLEETILSEGRFWFKRDNRVRIEYTKPYRYILILNGDQMIVRDENTENRLSTKSNKLLQQVNRIIVDCVQGTILENKNFSHRLFHNDTQNLLELIPQTQGLKDFFQAIVVVIDKKDYSVNSIDLREPGGDHTLLRFNRKVLNEKLDEAIFTR